MDTPRNRYGEKMIWVITFGWIFLCLLCHKIGWQKGVAEGTSLTIDELVKADIIMLDRQKDIICPGKAKIQSLKAYAESINSDEDTEDR